IQRDPGRAGFWRMRGRRDRFAAGGDGNRGSARRGRFVFEHRGRSGNLFQGFVRQDGGSGESLKTGQRCRILEIFDRAIVTEPSNFGHIWGRGWGSRSEFSRIFACRGSLAYASGFQTFGSPTRVSQGAPRATLPTGITPGVM